MPATQEQVESSGEHVELFSNIQSSADEQLELNPLATQLPRLPLIEYPAWHKHVYVTFDQ